MIEITYYRDSGGDYHGVTNQQVGKYDGSTICLGKGPKIIGGPVTERNYSEKTTRFWTKVEEKDVPADWFKEQAGQVTLFGDDSRHYKRWENKYKFKLVDIDKKYKFEFVPSKRSDEILVRVTWLVPRQNQEPLPVEITKLEILPSRCNNLMKNPWFWPVAIIAGVILFTMFRGCF